MLIKSVTNEFGELVQIDESTRKLYSYDNKNKKISYNAQIVEDGVPTIYYTNYVEDGIVNDISERLKTWNNKLLLLYSKCVGFDSIKNDADKKIYNALLEYVTNNQEIFFTATGDFKEKFLISDKEILNILK